MTTDVTNYGATGDGSTDDTAAIRRAADAAAPDGTVYFPSGTYIVGSSSRLAINYPDDGSWDDLTWRGEDWSTTTVKLAAGQTEFHNVFHVDVDHATITGTTFEQLTIDGNGTSQRYEPGTIISVPGNISGTVTIRDCHLKDSTTNAIAMRDGDLLLEHSMATDTGKGANQRATAAGHFCSVNASGTVTIRNCENLTNYGSFLDIGTGYTPTVTIEDCRIDAKGAMYSNLAKINPGASSLTIRRTVARNLGHMGMYCTPRTSSIGSITLDNVEFDGVDYAAIDLPGPADLTLDEVQFSNVDLESFRGPHAIWVSGDSTPVDFKSCRRIGAHNVGPSGEGEVLRAVDATGSIDEVVRDGTSSGLGDPGGVSVYSTTSGGPISPTYPDASEVGPRSPGTEEPEPTTSVETVIRTDSAGVIQTDGAGRLLSREAATQTGGSDTTTATIDSFEGDLSAWAGSTGRYSIVSASNTPMSAPDGNSVLKIAGDGGTGRLYSRSGDGLPRYFPKGTTARIYFYSEYGGSLRFHFGYTDSNNYYDAGAEFGADSVHLSRNRNGSYGPLDSASQSLSTGRLYYVDVTRDDGSLGGAEDDIRLEWYDGSGTLLQTLSANDATHAAADGVGVRGYLNRKPMYVDYLHLTRGV